MTMAAAPPSLEFEAFLSEVAGAIAVHVTPVAEADAPVRHEDHSARATPPVDPFILDHEKIVWHFPDVMARVIEELP